MAKAKPKPKAKPKAKIGTKVFLVQQGFLKKKNFGAIN